MADSNTTSIAYQTLTADCSGSILRAMDHCDIARDMHLIHGCHADSATSMCVRKLRPEAFRRRDVTSAKAFRRLRWIAVRCDVVFHYCTPESQTAERRQQLPYYRQPVQRYAALDDRSSVLLAEYAAAVCESTTATVVQA